MKLEQLTELIDLIYEAALKPEAWSQLLNVLSQRLGCESSVMRVSDTRDGQQLSEVYAGSFARDVEHYAHHFSGADTYLDRLKVYSADEHMLVFNGHETPIWPLAGKREELIKSGSHDISGYMFKAADTIVHIAIRCRHETRCGDFPLMLELLAPHLQRAMLVARQRRGLEERLESMEQAMDHFGSGVILVDGLGQPAFFNRQARELVSTEKGVRIAEGQLAGETAAVTRDLRGLIQAAIERGRHGGSQIGAMTIEHRNDGKINLSVVAVPLHPAIHALPHEPAIYAALLIGSSTFASGLDPAVLKLLYNLTGAEARLAIGLALGKSLDQYAAENAVRISTVRGYLKQIFQKTSTNRQTELVSLLRSIPFYLKEE